MSEPSRVLIVDDHPIVRQGLSALIDQQQELVLCGEAANVNEALRVLASSRPDLLIVDVSLKGESGIDLIKQIKANERRVKVLVCSIHEDLYFAERALNAGALGYVNKQEATDRLLDAIRTVLDGRVYLAPKMVARLLQRAVGSAAHASDPVDRLTDRELEIVELIGKALTTSEIAETLHLSPKTVETHREHIKAKLTLRNGAELTRWAVQWVLERT